MPPLAPSHSNIATIEAPRGGGRTDAVLLVEDEDALAVLITRVLQRSGWRVLYAADGAQARRLVATRGAEVTLAFVDCGLPDVSGPELCAEIRSAIPGVPLLLTSGRDQTAMARAFATGGPAAFLAKPYLPMDIGCRLEQLLARAA